MITSLCDHVKFFNGLLGLGDTAERLVPTRVTPPNGYRFTSLDTGPFTFDMLASVQPIPEPGALVIFALGVSITFLRRRRD